jgi:hypothetical protein
VTIWKPAKINLYFAKIGNFIQNYLRLKFLELPFPLLPVLLNFILSLFLGLLQPASFPWKLNLGFRWMDTYQYFRTANCKSLIISNLKTGVLL